MARKFIDIDLIVGAASVAWAIAAQHASSLAELCSPTAAFAFGTVAMGRGLLAIRKRLEEGEV